MATSSNNKQDLITRINIAADHASIDLTILPFYQEALDSIAALSTITTTDTPTLDFSNASRIDTHTHPIPSWFRALEPQAAGRETPSWNVSAHLKFMSEHAITHSVLCISTPQANAFPKDAEELRKKKTVALARLLNEFSAELCRLYPERFSWLAVTPLPYVDESVAEVRYALEVLGAVGVGVLTNHEGLYPGEEQFDPLWRYLEERGRETEKEVVFIHPTEPVIKLDDGRLVNSRPSPLRSGLGEFYFETARAISSITANKTITKFPNLHWRVSHGAGAFPDISERFLLGFPDVSNEARKAYKEHFWYDSAGPVYPNQVKGLTEGMGIPMSQLVFGTDYPYGIGFWDVDANIAGLSDADFLSSKEKESVFWSNARSLWEGKLVF
ncbi:Nn.00g038830.m01.CDS01 [Neocucurbitaria sp. VM-36]